MSDDAHLLINDPSSLPAVATTIGAIPASHTITAYDQLPHPDDAVLLQDHPGLIVHA
ncbi:SIP domain-containing protein [Rothia endophytica]|uniref:SIP domain-containing protein n=1 Tax=Rothia endophytica TaxID=1324766 RepID=UPI0031ECB4C4